MWRRTERRDLTAPDAQADGPAGEELIWNFIQVQPYFEE